MNADIGTTLGKGAVIDQQILASRVRNLRRFLAVLPGLFARFYPGYFSGGAFSIS
jgi:hypothetical protein